MLSSSSIEERHKVAERRKVEAIQALEKVAWNFCKATMDKLFNYDIIAKGSTNPVYGTQAHLCKNDILFVLERVMSFEGPNILTSHSGLEGRAGQPFQPSFFDMPGERHQGPSVSKEAISFMAEYEKRMDNILTTYDKETAEDHSGGSKQTKLPPRRKASRSVRRRRTYHR
jgi:hypothetical protein